MINLADLERFSTITIQCHNNPDADSIGSGFGLYRYFTEKKKQVRLIYSGSYRIHKSNLKLLVEKLFIPIEYVPPEQAEKPLPGLLIMVDCQYGEGNAVCFAAEHVAVVDHHEPECQEAGMGEAEFSEIWRNLGSCCTLVWQLLKKAGYPVDTDKRLGTALYYGLLMDTRQFEELYHPLDRDMRDSLCYERELVSQFRKSNLSVRELEIAGIALLRSTFNDKYHYAIIKAQPCDPNILGIISDFLIQVDAVDTCLVYNEQEDGLKVSVRSCVPEVRANEFVSYITAGIGSGGGHNEKAGGFISAKRYERCYPTLHSEAFFNQKINQYFDDTEIVYAASYRPDVHDMQRFHKRDEILGFVRTTDVRPEGTHMTIRTQEGDLQVIARQELYLLIGGRGQVMIRTGEEFARDYRILEGRYRLEEWEKCIEYVPTVRSSGQAQSTFLVEEAGLCAAVGEAFCYGRQLQKRIKLFPATGKAGYRVGEAGDYLMVSASEEAGILVVEKKAFENLFEEET